MPLAGDAGLPELFCPFDPENGGLIVLSGWFSFLGRCVRAGPRHPVGFTLRLPTTYVGAQASKAGSTGQRGPGFFLLPSPTCHPIVLSAFRAKDVVTVLPAVGCPPRKECGCVTFRTFIVLLFFMADRVARICDGQL